MDNIEYNVDKGTHSFVSSNNESAWHSKGVILPQKFLTAEECLKYANLDFEVALAPVEAKIQLASAAHTYKPVKDRFATYRTDNFDTMGVVGTRYTIVQNRDGFSFFDSIVGDKQAIYTTAGVLGKGETVFITAKMPEIIRIEGTDDITEVYVALKLSHDGSGAVKAMTTPVRIVCANTLAMALQGTANKVSIRHTANAGAKLKTAHELLGISRKYVEEVNEVLNRFSKVKISDQAFKELVEVLFVGTEDSTRLKNTHEAVLNSYYAGVGQDGITGTLYGAYNGITYFLDNVKSYRSADTKFEAILEGSSAQIRQQAFNHLLQLS